MMRRWRGLKQRPEHQRWGCGLIRMLCRLGSLGEVVGASENTIQEKIGLVKIANMKLLS